MNGDVESLNTFVAVVLSRIYLCGKFIYTHTQSFNCLLSPIITRVVLLSLYLLVIKPLQTRTLVSDHAKYPSH